MHSDAIALLKLSDTATAGGASALVDGICDVDPMCMLTDIRVSSQVWKNGSHSPEWIDGRPNSAGISEKQTAWTSRSALRRTSAASSGSQSGTMVNQAAVGVPEIGVEDSDLVLTRLHGLGPMAGTDLDPILR
ncbi:MAG: hypothetical protein OSA99_17375, partial [Acidimicrobiales bacterium]|nr:hypothetical protein [Acidimicrobiales bacterium]